MVLIFCLFFFNCYHYYISDLEVKKVSKDQRSKTLTEVFEGFLLLFFFLEEFLVLNPNL